MSEENVQETNSLATSSTQTNEDEEYYHRRVILNDKHFIESEYLRDHIACVRIQPQTSNRGRHDLHYNIREGVNSVKVENGCCNGISLFTAHGDENEFTNEFTDEVSAEEYRRGLWNGKRLGLYKSTDNTERWATSICFKIKKTTLDEIVARNRIWQIEGDSGNPQHKLLQPLAAIAIDQNTIFSTNLNPSIRLIHFGSDAMGDTSNINIWRYCSCVRSIVGGAENVVGAGNYDAFGDTVVRSLENLIEDPDLDPPTKRQYEEIFDELHELSLLTLQEIFSVKSHLMEKIIEILEDEGDVDLIKNAKRMMNQERPKRFELIKTVFNYCYPIVLFVHYYDNDRKYGLTRNKEFTKTLLYKILKYIRESLSHATLDTSMGIFICVAKNLLLIYRTFGMDLAEMEGFEKFVMDDDHFTYKDETGATFYCTTNDVMTEIEKWHLFRTYHIMLGNLISRLGQEMKRSRSDYYPFTLCESFDWKSALHNIDEPPEFKNGCEATDEFGVKVLQLIKNVDKRQFSKEFDLSFVFTELNDCQKLNVEYWRTAECQTRQFIMRLVEINVCTSGDRLLGTYFTPEDSGKASCPDEDVHKCFIDESRKMLKIGEDISLIVKPVGSANIVQLFVGNGQVETIFNFQAPEQVSFNISDNIKLQYNKIDESAFLQHFFQETQIKQTVGHLSSSNVWDNYKGNKNSTEGNDSANEPSAQELQKKAFYYSVPILILYQQFEDLTKCHYSDYFETFTRSMLFHSMETIQHEVWNARTFRERRHWETIKLRERQHWERITSHILHFYDHFEVDLLRIKDESQSWTHERHEYLKNFIKYHLYHLFPKDQSEQLLQKSEKLGWKHSVHVPEMPSQQFSELPQSRGTVKDWLTQMFGSHARSLEMRK
jgi:hypothetical protein